MSRVRARARSGRSCRPSPPEAARGLRGHPRATSTASSCPGLSHWQHPRFFGYFPSNGELAVGARRLPQHRPRRARPLLAVEPGAHRDRGGDDRLGAADGRPVGRVERRHPGHGLDRARSWRSLCARERASGYSLARGGLQAEARAARRLRLGAQPQLGRQGRAARRLRPRERARVAADDALRDATRRARRGRSAPTVAAGRRPCAVVATTGTTTTTAVDPRRRDRRRSRASTACGCTSTPRWPARR